MVTVTKYVWDPVFDCVTHELDENNNVKAEYHNEPQPYGGVLSQRRGTTSHYHHHDALGSTRFLTDSSGNVTDTYLNDAWGNPVASTGSTVNPFKWVGKYGYYTDNSTGQVYVRARMYQPTSARWCSVDPRGFVDGPNLLSYSRNIPTQLFDPSGFSGWLECPAVHSGEEFICNYGSVHVSPIKSGTDGVQIALHFEQSLKGPCCPTCSSFRWIQVVSTNWAQPFFVNPQTVVPRTTFVDNGNGQLVGNRTTEPWYGGYSDPGKAGRPPVSMFPPSEFDYKPSVASMWDYPKRSVTRFNGPNGSFIPDGDLTWQAVSCVVCLRDPPLPDIVLGCVSWGFTRSRIRPGNQPGAFGDAQSLGPTCLGADSGPFGGTNALIALFRNTLDYDEFVDYDFLEDYTFDAKGTL
jgi:RHS repeat-associated protein